VGGRTSTFRDVAHGKQVMVPITTGEAIVRLHYQNGVAHYVSAKVPPTRTILVDGSRLRILDSAGGDAPREAYHLAKS
jgi:hypothetical protein